MYPIKSRRNPRRERPLPQNFPEQRISATPSWTWTCSTWHEQRRRQRRERCRADEIEGKWTTCSSSPSHRSDCDSGSIPSIVSPAPPPTVSSSSAPRARSRGTWPPPSIPSRRLGRASPNNELLPPSTILRRYLPSRRWRGCARSEFGITAGEEVGVRWRPERVSVGCPSLERDCCPHRDQRCPIPRFRRCETRCPPRVSGRISVFSNRTRLPHSSEEDGSTPVVPSPPGCARKWR
mmetsp:Transcript_15044/g.30624  ORF Transcript_15044/g.30624 Transcript_15044/m.30624 type:complete len:236 (+) Transcript_15044:403-1110(+)